MGQVSFFNNIESASTPKSCEGNVASSEVRWTPPKKRTTTLHFRSPTNKTPKRKISAIKLMWEGKVTDTEVNSGAKLLQDVVHDLEDVVLICQGEKKQTNYHRAMLSDLVKGIIPPSWRRYTVPNGCTVIQWVTDFCSRVKQLQQVSQLVSQGGAKEIRTYPVWLGGLLNPEAYITATRRCIAQANSWSLEELMLDVSIVEGANTADQCSFGVTGLKLQGAQCRNNQLLLASTIMTDLPMTLLRWVHSTPGSDTKPGKISLPVYLNSTRTELLFTVDLNIAPGQDQHSFYERGVAY